MILKKRINRFSNFIQYDIWKTSFDNKPPLFTFFVKQLRLIIVAIKGFNENRCVEKASSLTYYSLLSIVPVFALMFGIAKGFGFEKKMEEHLYSTMGDKKEVLDQIFEFTHQMLENTQGGLIAGVGMVMLLWSVMKLLSNIEKSFNEIWEITQSRSTVRKISDYFSIMLLAPILIVISNSATTFISDYVRILQNQYEWTNYLGWLISVGLKIMPWSLIWFTFAFLYMLMPNTKVFFSSAFVGGIIGGIVFQVVQYFYIKFQVGVGSYNAIYGSFAALPLFLAWLQLSWLIVLLGAEISFASQNANKYEFEFETKNISNSFRTKLCIFVARHLAIRFENEQEILTASELAKELNLPHRILSSIVHELIEAKILIHTSTDDYKTHGIQIAIPISKLSIYKVVELLDCKGINSLEMFDDLTYKTIETKINHLTEELKNSSNNLLLTQIKLEN